MLRAENLKTGCRAARERRGWSLRQVAAATGINIASLSRYERGAQRLPELREEVLAGMLGIRRVELQKLNEEDDRA
jgi:transcriptional regulator with XRE-family HTH domain